MVRVICDSPEELFRTSAELVTSEITAILDERDFVTLTLSGGSTPKGLYRLLAARQEIPWEKVHLLWGDERMVSPDSIDSNYRMARESLIDGIAIPAENVHRISSEQGAEEAARNYERTINELCGGLEPTLDIVLLGLGPDGHTASLFPDQPQLSAEGLVTATPPAPREPRVRRVTMTFSLLNKARTVLFLVSGEEKRTIVADILSGSPRADGFPAIRIRPKGRLIWAVYPEP